MIRSLWFIHVLLMLAMIGVGGMAGNILNGGPQDAAAAAQLWLAATAFGALTVANLMTSFILTKAGFQRLAGRIGS